MTAIPSITVLPAPPQRGQESAIFAQKADAFIDALFQFAPDLNQFAQALRDEFYNLSVVKFTATSTTSVAIGTGAKAFTITQGVAFIPGQTLMIASAADPTKYMQGAITSYDSATGALVVNVTVVGGTGTRTDWKIGLVPAFDIDAIINPINARLAQLAPTSNWPEASTAEARAAAVSRLISAARLWAMYEPVALADGATVPVDLSAGVNFSLVLAGNRTLAAPTNLKPGQRGFIRVTMDAAGRTLSYAAAYKFPDAVTAPSLNDGGVTLLEYTVSATGEVFIGGGKPLATIGGGHPGYASGRTYVPFSGPISSATVAGNATTAVQFPIPTSTTISGVRVPATTNASTSVRVGIYTNVNGSPGVLLAEAGGTTSTSADTTVSLPLTLAPGVYWEAVRYAASVSVQSTTGPSVSTIPFVGSPNGQNFNNPAIGLITTGGSAAALQNPFSVTGAATVIGLVGIVIP